MSSEREILRHFYAGAVMDVLFDVAIAVAVAYFTDSGITGFLVTFLGLQVIYFLIWLKKTSLMWLRFWWSGRRKMTGYFLDGLQTKNYPAPGHEVSLPRYLQETMDDDRLPIETRLDAARELGARVELNSLFRFSLGMQFDLAFRDAAEKWRHSKFDEELERAPPPR